MSDTVDVYFVDHSDYLAKLAKQWSSLSCIAVDTEFERRTTYYAKLALVQIYDGEAVYLIDPLKVECPDALRDLLYNCDVIKILHSCKEDLEVLFTAWDCKMRGLFDTQVACNFLYQELSLGYAKLVERFTLQIISKQQTNSDWLKRPLSSAQLNYAALDVIYLIDIYQKLYGELQTKNFNRYFVEECDELCRDAVERVLSDPDYSEAKDVWLLSAIDLSLFIQLFNWRESKAKQENRTKNHIIKDHALVQMAILKPDSESEIKKLPELHPRSCRRYGQDWIDIINHWQASANQLSSASQSNNKAIKKIPNPRDVAGLKELSTQFENIVKTIAKENHLSHTLVLSKRLIRKLAFSLLTASNPPNQWHGWRKKLLNESFTQASKKFIH